MIKIILNGCNGKMGQVITRLCESDEDVKIAAGFDINTEKRNDYPVFSNPADFEGEADVLIDFSHPDSLSGILEFCTKKNVPAVVATTGLSNSQKNELLAASEKTAIFFSANMSLGINLLIDLAKKASKLLEENFDIEIIERHHNQKIDAPSGTALAIADGISEALSYEPEYTYDRHSVRKKRKKAEIGLHALRGGTIVGDHTVVFAGNDEVIELHHSAASKEVFAVGSIKAAKFLSNKGAGMYNMNDLISAL